MTEILTSKFVTKHGPSSRINTASSSTIKKAIQRHGQAAEKVTEWKKPISILSIEHLPPRVVFTARNPELAHLLAPEPKPSLSGSAPTTEQAVKTLLQKIPAKAVVSFPAPAKTTTSVPTQTKPRSSKPVKRLASLKRSITKAAPSFAAISSRINHGRKESAPPSSVRTVSSTVSSVIRKTPGHQPIKFDAPSNVHITGLPSQLTGVYKTPAAIEPKKSSPSEPMFQIEIPSSFTKLKKIPVAPLVKPLIIQRGIPFEGISFRARRRAEKREEKRQAALESLDLN